jgi:hypothetical protein
MTQSEEVAMSFKVGAILVSSILLGYRMASAADHAKRWKPEIPRVWDEAALADWPTPVAGLKW